MPPRQVLAATGTAARAGVNARPTTRSSTRLSQQAPVQYAQPPLPSITKPSKRRAAKGDATEPLAKKRKVTKSGDQKSLIVVFKIPSASSSSDVPSKFDAVQDFGLPSPSTPAENKMSEPAIQAASGAVKSYQGNFAPPKTTRKRKQSSGACATRGSVFTEDPRPDPCGTPPAWAAERPSLCESLPFFRCTQGGGYANGKYGYGYLIDGDSGDRRYMDNEIIITRAGGGDNTTEDGVSTQRKDQVRTNAMICSFLNSMENNIPIGIIVGKSGPCPTKPLHRYSVLDWFHLTGFWAEKNDGKVCFKYRFEKILLDKKSWWAPVGSANPPPTRDFENKASRKTCASCHQESPQVYNNGWICLQEHCGKFWKLNGTEPPSDMDFNPAFLNERTLYADKDGVPNLLPEMPDPVADAAISTERNSWKGLVCPKCLACTARAHWDSWRCETDGCGFILPVQHTVKNYHSLLLAHQAEITGRALSLDTWSSPIQAPTTENLGFWRIQTFDIPGLGTVTHFQSNAHINRKTGGPHQMLEDLQKADLELCRHKMKCSPVSGTRTAHFAHDYGMPYNYIVGQENTALEDAPAVIKNALGRMTWAGRHYANGADFVPYNEVLALGYFEGGKIGFHDDGEESLAGTIATMSIGADAEMALRFKGKYHFVAKNTTYDPTAPIYEGFQESEARLALKALYDQGKFQEYEVAKKELFKKYEGKKPGGQPPTILRLNLKHGDFVVMSGDKLQKYTEHQITPNAEGKMRYALTARHVKREFAPEDQHWKGDFVLPDEFSYDGDINIVAEVQAARAARESPLGNSIHREWQVI